MRPIALTALQAHSVQTALQVRNISILRLLECCIQSSFRCLFCASALHPFLFFCVWFSLFALHWQSILNSPLRLMLLLPQRFLRAGQSHRLSMQRRRLLGSGLPIVLPLLSGQVQRRSDRRVPAMRSRHLLFLRCKRVRAVSAGAVEHRRHFDLHRMWLRQLLLFRARLLPALRCWKLLECRQHHRMQRVPRGNIRRTAGPVRV